MEDLIREYRETLRRISRARENSVSEVDRELLGNMASDLKYAIEWMTTGRQPGNRRGIERLAAYQREKPIDPIHIQNYVMRSKIDEENNSPLSDWDIQRIEDALSVLTDLERDVYIMSRGHCIPYSEIAMMMGIKKGTVQKMIERAEKKMMKRKETSLFCVG